MSKKEAQKELVTTIRTSLTERMKFDDQGIPQGDKEEIGKVYADHLPEGLSMKEVQAVHDYNTAFVAAVAGTATHAAGVLNTRADLDNVTYEVPMHGRDKVQVMASRDQLSVGVVTSVANPKAGELKQAFSDYYAALEAAKED